MISCLSIVILCWLCTAGAQLDEHPGPTVYNIQGYTGSVIHSVSITNSVGESEWIVNLNEETSVKVQYQYPTIEGHPDLDMNISITATRDHFGRVVQEREVFTKASHPDTVRYLASALRTKVTYRDIKLEQITIVFNYTQVPCGRTLKTNKERINITPFYRGVDHMVDCVWHIISPNATAIKIDAISNNGKPLKVQGVTILGQQSGSSMLRTIYNSPWPNATTYHYSDDLKITLLTRNAVWFSQVVLLDYEIFAQGCSTHFSGIEGDIATPTNIDGTTQCLYIIDKQTRLRKFRLNIMYPKLPSEVSYHLDVRRLDSFGTEYETNGTLETKYHIFTASDIAIYYKTQAKSPIVVQPMHLSFKYISDTQARKQVRLLAQLRLLNSRLAGSFGEYLESMGDFQIKLAEGTI